MSTFLPSPLTSEIFWGTPPLRDKFSGPPIFYPPLSNCNWALPKTCVQMYPLILCVWIFSTCDVLALIRGILSNDPICLGYLHGHAKGRCTLGSAFTHACNEKHDTEGNSLLQSYIYIAYTVGKINDFPPQNKQNTFFLSMQAKLFLHQCIRLDFYQLWEILDLFRDRKLFGHCKFHLSLCIIFCY